MRTLLIWVGRSAGILGIALMLLAGVVRLSGAFWLGGFHCTTPLLSLFGDAGVDEGDGLVVVVGEDVAGPHDLLQGPGQGGSIVDAAAELGELHGVSIA